MVIRLHPTVVANYLPGNTMRKYNIRRKTFVVHFGLETSFGNVRDFGNPKKLFNEK
jgi:hypothetical protein